MCVGSYHSNSIQYESRESLSTLAIVFIVTKVFERIFILLGLVSFKKKAECSFKTINIHQIALLNDSIHMLAFF